MIWNSIVSRIPRLRSLDIRKGVSWDELTTKNFLPLNQYIRSAHFSMDAKDNTQKTHETFHILAEQFVPREI